ncbi:MAG: hypothetical protein QXT66_07380 [Nitrososphaerota archaeon]
MATADSILRRGDVINLLRLMQSGTISELRPELDSQRGFYYPSVEGIINSGTEDVNLILRTLADLEILKRELQDSVNSCPKCGGVCHVFSVRCPTCNSTRLEKGPVIEHLACGHIDFEQAFIRGNVYQCPKCRKTMTTLGVDYRRPGSYYKCIQCGRITGLPTRYYTCTRCNNISAEEDLALSQGYRYVLNPEKSAFISNYTLDLRTLIETAESSGWVVRTPATIQGNSGVAHTFAFLAHNPRSPPNEGLAIDVEVSVDKVDQSKVLSLFSKALDAAIQSTALGVVGDIEERAKVLARSFGIHLVVGSNVADVMARLSVYLSEFIKRKGELSLKVEAEELEKLIKSLEKVS